MKYYAKRNYGKILKIIVGKGNQSREELQIYEKVNAPKF
jgi:hypothetical protein